MIVNYVVCKSGPWQSSVNESNATFSGGSRNFVWWGIISPSLYSLLFPLPFTPTCPFPPFPLHENIKVCTGTTDIEPNFTTANALYPLKCRSSKRIFGAFLGDKASQGINF